MNLTRKNKARLAFEMLEKEFEVLSLLEMQNIKGGLHFNNFTELLAYVNQHGVTSEIADKAYTIGADGLAVTNIPFYYNTGSSAGALADLVISNIMALNNQSAYQSDEDLFSYISFLAETATGTSFPPTNNALCVFNSMYEVINEAKEKLGFLPGGLAVYSPQLFYDNFIGTYGASANNYAADGVTHLGVSQSQQMMIDEYAKYGVQVTSMTGQASQIKNFIQNGGKIITERIGVGPEGQQANHSIIIEGISADGNTFYYKDTTTGEYGSMPRFAPPGALEYNAGYMLGFNFDISGSSSGGDNNALIGSSGLFATGYDGSTYWENYYVYEENGDYTPGNGPYEEAQANYSTGYWYFTTEESTGV